MSQGGKSLSPSLALLMMGYRGLCPSPIAELLFALFCVQKQNKNNFVDGKALYRPDTMALL